MSGLWEGALLTKERNLPSVVFAEHTLAWVDNHVSFAWFNIRSAVVVHDRWPAVVLFPLELLGYKNPITVTSSARSSRLDLPVMLEAPPAVAF